MHAVRVDKLLNAGDLRNLSIRINLIILAPSNRFEGNLNSLEDFVIESFGA